MIVGTILLTHKNQYVKDDGSLPSRPDFDKALLSRLATNKLVSLAGYSLLPPSIKKVVKCSNSLKFSMPITIKELALSDLLIISRSPEVFEGGKVFRLTNFTCLAKDTQIEIWIRNSNE